MPPGRRRKEAAELPAERPEEPPVEDEDADKEPRPPSVLTAGEREEIARSDLLNMPIPERPVPAMSAGPGGERLMITKIVVENFKSYFGREILGPFHKNFTSILGPNGSGKSNVIDSLLFVFGFRANRIRSKKVSSLIHSSAAHPNVASCKVEVFFGKIVDKGDHDFEVRPGSEFSVSRTATKSGQSAYQVNGRTATTGEVRERLRANGIDLDHNRFLILQGEVEQIALMKPKGCERSGVDGMLEYLEDIIGSSRLKEPIEKLKKKLEWFNNEEDMVQKRVDLALSEVEQMAEPVLQVLRMITVENAITDCTHKLLSIRKCELGQRQREGGERFTKAKEELREARTELNKCEEDFKNETAVKTEMLKNSDKLKDRIRKAEEAERDVEVNAKKTADRVKSLEKKIASKEAEIEREEEKLQEARDAPARARQLIEEQTATIETRTEQIAELEEELRELRKKKRDANAATRRQLEEIMPRIGVMNEEEAKCEGNVALAKDKLERMQSASTNFEQKYVEAENRFRKVQEDHELSKRELAAQEQQIPQLRAEVASGEAEVRGIREQEHALVQKFNGLNSELQVARAQADGNRTQNAALAALNQEHVKGRLGGLLGRLGDLGGIDERYDVAISTCCPQLETVAVETVECAQECIEFLKARNMPRMTFIALDKQQHLWPRIENKPQTPEDQPRLIDLIQVSDRRLLPAFYSALHDTLVVDTIERASRVSNHEGRRWRVVTLRGEVVETSGTMSGGGRQEKRGAMGKRARVDTSQRTPAVDLREMERQLGEKREQLNRLRSQLEAKNSELQTRKDDLAQAVHNQRLISQRISVFKKQLEEASNQMARAKTAFESLDVDEDAICALRDEMNRFEREKESVCQRASELRKTKEKLEAEIKKVEDRVLGKAQSQLKKWKSELKAAEDTLCRETLVLKNSAATIQRIETTIRRAKDGIEEAEGDVRRATEQLERQRQDVQTRAEEKVALAEQLEELQAAIVRKTEEIAALVQREEEARRPLQDKEKEVEEASREVEKLLKKVQKVDEDIGKLSVIQVRQDMLPFLYDAMAKRGRGAQNEETASNRSPNQREGSANSTPASSQQTQEGEEDAPANEQQAEAERMEVDQPEDREAAGEADADAEEVATAIEPVEIPSTTIITADDGSTHDPAFDTGSLPSYSEEEIVAFDRAQLEAKVERYEAKKRAFRTPMNLQLVDDFGEKMDKQNRVVAQMQQLVDEKNAHRRLFDRLSRMRSDEFMDGFQQIRLATQEIHQMITLGGDASLNAIDSLDPFKEGVAFQVRPPKKTWRQITNLSGGEKTLASLALVFGLHNFRPTPLYVMDEIDAALDFRNVSIIATYLKERTKNAQFIIISLRNNMFEKADRLIGIYKVRDCTHNLTVEYGDSLRADRPQEHESQQPRVDVRTPSQSPLAKRHRSNEHEERWD